MKKTIILIPFVIIGILFFGCTDETPLGIEQHTLDIPNSPPAIAESNLTDGDDFSVGYYNGNIRSDMVHLEWEASEDENFLAYKIFRATGGYGGDISEGFEGGSLPSGWTEYGDNGGWYVTSGDSMNYPYSGDYFIQSNYGYYDYEYLEKTITVPQNEYIFISFYGANSEYYWDNDSNGRLYINGSYYDDWGYYPIWGEGWQYYSYSYYTGSNTEITLQWLWYTGYYGYGLLDNIEISGVEGGELSYSLVETLNDKNTSAFWDTTLTQNQYYTYKVATIVEQGTHTVDDIEIKTPLWQVPSNINYEILSPEVVEVIWEDNSESESSFKVYLEEYNEWYGYYETASSQSSSQDDNSMVISGLSTDTQYRIGVKAYNTWESTDTTYSSSFQITFESPSNLSANQQGGSKLVDLSWSDNSSLEDGFEIERDTGSGFVLLTTVSANTTSYTDTDTTNFVYDETYTYRVRAYNDYSGMIYTEYSNEASVTISELTGIFVSFEDGQIPSGWSNWGYSGWYVTNESAYEGNYSIRCYSSYYNNEYLETIINVPQDTYINISFTHKGDDDGDGYFYINGNQYLHWGYDYYGNSWYTYQDSYYTGSNTQITLQWRYSTEYYGYGYLDNIQVTW